jgi:hypothetical protein
MFIPDQDLDFIPIPDPRYRGSKRHRIRIRNIVRLISFLTSEHAEVYPEFGV